MDILNGILEAIRPETLGDIFIYTIFVLSVVNLILLPDGNDIPMYLIFTVLVLCVVDLLRNEANLPIQGTDDRGFFTFIIHIGMFLAPAFTAGAIRVRNNKGGSARLVALLISLIGLLYLVGTFYDPAMFYGAGAQVINW